MENKYRSLDELPLALRVEDLMPILGIGRNTAYELVRSGQIRSIKSGVKSACRGTPWSSSSVGIDATTTPTLLSKR